MQRSCIVDVPSMEGLGRECVGDTEDLELATGIEIEAQMPKLDFRRYSRLQYVLPRPLGLNDFARSIVGLFWQERLGFLPPKCADFVELNFNIAFLPVFEPDSKRSGDRMDFGILGVGCSEARIERFDARHTFLARPNV